MKFEDEWEENLYCPKCGYKVTAERYGYESEEEFNAAYPTLEEVLARGKEAKPEEETEKK